MKDAVYNTIGTNYNKNRTADNRLLKTIKDLLNLPLDSVIADIGAGTGNYSNGLANAGYKIKAVEPSEEMHRQITANSNVSWLFGKAESIPLPDNCVDGIIVTLAIHHFFSIQDAALEMHRICSRGPVVIFTLDPRESEEFWFADYFPEINQKEFSTFPPIHKVTAMITDNNKWSSSIHKFPLPCDFTDLNMRSGWNRPEIYLESHARQSMSGFALCDESIINNGLKKLRRDLESGEWDKKYGYLREQKYFDAGFRFIKLTA